ncbi:MULTISPECIES: hypothetical protein [Hydrocarboniphaga]|jgi:hypothetical protein|uniref:dATP pyrophosphohydrolase n=2 Tax=Hydrocarboniphaga effusa TaxID=243629 RepID=I8T6P7_9GAMM|nr:MULTISPECIES: hypothetical protein [Hydrocarboniphaga]EIT69408.1 hypothetical protein WQQ_29900 [Hydrocarboniphaga effusa AP103]MDZ4079201.1 dATP pyrophosphohydrolase [Hydrocarboniphaga sp.]
MTTASASSALQIVPVNSPAEFKRFIRLPAQLHKHDPLYVAPLEMERAESLSPKTNPYFEHAEVQFWLAVQGGRDVGRISAQVDKLAAPGTGHFGLIDAIDDAEVFSALFETAENWLKARGCTVAIGPFNLSINEETGLLVQGFDTPPAVMMSHDFPYVGTRVEGAGYVKAKDLIAYNYDVTAPLPAVAQRMVDRKPANIKVRTLDAKRYLEDIQTVTHIFNDAWADNWGFVPYTPAEIDHLARALKPLIDPKLAPIAEIDGRPVAFGILLPNLNEAIREFNGKLLPFNWAKLLWRLKVSGVKSGRLPLMGVRRDIGSPYAAALAPFLVIEAIRSRTAALGYKTAELSWILENNLPMRRMIEAVGGKPYKTYRVYQKSLVQAPA